MRRATAEVRGGLARYIPPFDDGIAWIVAAVILLVAVFVAHVPVPAAVLLSLVAYLGLALTRAERAPATPSYVGTSDEEALAISRTKVAQLRALGKTIPDPEVRNWIDGFCDQATAIMGVIEEDRKYRAAPLFLQGIVTPTEELLREYARLANRGVQAAQPSLDRVKRENLPLITHATEDFYQQLHQTDVAEIDTLSERLEFNLIDRLPAIGRGER
jgi:hypothetical protein